MRKLRLLEASKGSDEVNRPSFTDAFLKVEIFFDSLMYRDIFETPAYQVHYTITNEIILNLLRMLTMLKEQPIVT